ncbi:MAG: hypothetical protein R3D44_13435 [Hyphomicrobiaceae bacterium]
MRLPPPLAQILLSALVLHPWLATATRAEPPQHLAVDVTNASEPVLCAEKDNVTLSFSSPETRSFRIEAVHPAYIGTLARDSFEADWTACDMSKDTAHASDVKTPTRRTLYEEPALWVVGWKMPTFWRPATATVRIGDRVEAGLHLVQVWMIRPMGGEEVLVFYPQDGYWRVRPMAPEGRAPTAFGTSFLIGPVETDIRPIVKLKEVAFDPEARRFTLSFANGGTATMTMTEVTTSRHVLDVTLNGPISDRPFAALRSMYVTEFNNDVAHIASRPRNPTGWSESPVMAFKGGAITALWAGRTTVSRHNSSSPDMVVSHFAR